MKSSALLGCLAWASATHAAYSGDIVQYWVDQTSLLLNGTVIGGLQSPPSGWLGAVVQGAVYAAAVQASAEKSLSLAERQLAVSYAAHDALAWAFQGTRLYRTVDAAFATAAVRIGLNGSTTAGAKQARAIGEKAAVRVAAARAGDGLARYVAYSYGPPLPGVYQQTPGGAPLPDTPQAAHVRSFGGVGSLSKFRSAPPPATTSHEYEKSVLYVKEQGERNSTVRAKFDTETAYYWRESSFTYWNRFATAAVGNSLATDVVASAKFYAQLNYALANAGLAAWDTKFFYDAWRPVTALQRTDIWLASGRNVSAPSWTPLLTPTPSHPDYPSTHATFGAAAAAVIRAWNGGDVLKKGVTVSSNVTVDGIGVITRTYTNLTYAAEENAASRIFGGIHFQFAGSAGLKLGDDVAKATLKAFDKHWDEF